MEFSRWGEGRIREGLRKRKSMIKIYYMKIFSVKKNKKEIGYNHFYVPLFGLLQEDVSGIYKYLNFSPLLP